MSQAKALKKGTKLKKSKEDKVFDFITINEQIQNIAQKKDTLCRMMYN